MNQPLASARERPPGVAGGSIRNVLVHLDGGEGAPERLHVAHRVGRRFGAHVYVLYCVESTMASLRLAISESPGALFETREQAGLHQARRCFEDGALAGDAGTWLETGGDDPQEAFLRQARSADLVVVGTPEARSESRAAAPSALVESVLLHVGRPLLLVPAAGSTWHDDADVLVGWNGSPQAARALGAALPWLARAAHVHVLVSEAEAAASIDDGLDVRGALRRHGVEPIMHSDAGDQAQAGQRLAALAQRLGAGLVVMGGYGHGRLQERVLGGATAFMLHAAPLPVLMAH